jgi:hypothetical protein
MTSKQQCMVALISDLDELDLELTREPLWMVRPQFSRRFSTQRMVTTAEIVELSDINLAKMHTFETV